MADLRPVQGLYYEDYIVGASISSQGRTVTESDIVGFAMLSGDWNPLHTDAQTAQATPYGERIAHGLLVLSIATGLAERLGFMHQTVLGFMGLEWQFRAAVRIGDTVRVQATVAELKPMPRLGGGYVTFKVQILNQEDKTVQRGEWILLIKSRDA
ncbi:MAG TPA: MaoC/PaaZ C-terminal domain-containing protein [Anaerolineae bacterium]|nr:MaoC/PaaZ C-terminal domain-containing protein [Anaerolineae bacterium]HNU05048.1 MaoC/PaaZ C-terminal domain-containing protein [Anaerolineae bacterium]